MSGQSGGIDNRFGTISTGGGDAIAGDNTTNVTHHHYGINTGPRQRFRSTIPALRNRFVGREDLLQEIAAGLGEPSKGGVIVLRGPAGVGKSELAREFARQHLKEYPGGTFFIIADDQNLLVELSRLGQREFRDSPEHLSLEDRAIWTLQALGTAPTLLVYDNVISEESVQPWLPSAGMPCHVIITTLLDRWDGWVSLEVKPLSREISLDLIADIAGGNLAGQYGQRLAEIADGLPVQLVSASASLAYQARRGHVDAASFILLDRKARGSFSGVYQLLPPSARLLVHAAARLNPQRIPRDELKRHLIEAVGWSEGEFQRHLDGCLDLFVLQGESELQMHQLFARFVLDTQRSDDLTASLVNVVRVQATRMIELAVEVATHPNHLNQAALLLMFSPDPRRWCAGADHVSVSDGEIVGSALLQVGQFAAAQPWFERAVEAAEQGDIHGRVDHASLGRSLHQVGSCLWSQGQFAAAQPWCERAVEAAEQGDIHGRVDHESLGRSLQQVGYCLWSQGQSAAAQPWFERAVKAAEQGDIHGHAVDHASLGRSLHQVGSCLASQGQFAAAQPWFERAVAAAEQADIHGRVDHASLGRSLQQVGSCLASQGQFAAAQPWCERGVEAAEQGDIHGRVDHASLGSSLHQVGSCLLSQGQFAAAQPWFERAVKAAEQGDIHGRVDHASLGRSLHQVGYCLSSQGQFAAAQPWFERAVKAAEQGDIHGRVDHAILGGSLHQVGYCLWSQGQFAAAQPWFERAVMAAEQGDIHGRVDHASLGASLQQVGDCLASQGQFAAAQPWFERAV